MYGNRALRKRGKGNNWEASFYYRDPKTNQRKVIYRTFQAGTRKTAESKRDEIRYQLELGGKLDKSSATVEELMTKFVDYKDRSGTIEDSTVVDYVQSTNFVARWIGDVKICDLTPDDVNEFMADALEGGYAPATIGKPFRLLKEALDYAVINGLVERNVCDYCKPPRRTKPKVRALSADEARRMMDLAFTAGHERLGIAVVLALTTGMRRGEICGLRWSDVDLEAGALTVNHALAKSKKGGGYYLKCPKTGEARTIPLPARTLALLREVRKDQLAGYKAIHAKAPDSYVCGNCDPDCKPYNPAMLGKDFKAFCTMNGFDINLHGLRHTFATLMISSGVDVRTVSSYLGHASPSMTLDVYAEVDPQAKQAALGKIESVFNAGLVEQGVQMVAERLPEPPMVESPLLTQEAPKPKNPALELLFSDAPEALSDEERLFLLNLAKKCV